MTEASVGSSSPENDEATSPGATERNSVVEVGSSFDGAGSGKTRQLKDLPDKPSTVVRGRYHP
jgi:hypothetical protein